MSSVVALAMTAAAFFGLAVSVGSAQQAVYLRSPGTTNAKLEIAGALADFAQQHLLKGTGDLTIDYQGSDIVEPVLMIFDLGTRDIGFIRLKSGGVPGGGGSGGAPADASGSGLNISRDGGTVVGYLDNGFFTPNHAFRWTEASGLVDLGTLDPANNAMRSSYAHAVSSDGSVIVGYSSIGPLGYNHAFRWTESSGMVALDPSANDSNSPPQSFAFGVSGDGSVIVGQRDFRAFRWTEVGGFQGLGPTAYFANAVTADGAAIIGQTTNNMAFRWTEGSGVQNLGVLPGDFASMATGVSDDGNIVVGISTTGFVGRSGVGTSVSFSPDNSRAFYWTAATGMQDLTQLLADAGVDMTGITVRASMGISPDGNWIGGAAFTPATEPGVTTPILASLTATLSVPGDYNGSGVVDAADYTIWRNTLGQNVTAGSGADGSGPGGTPNGVVDSFDYDFWKGRFGASSGDGGGANLANAPEPVSMLLVGAALSHLLVFCVRRRIC